MCRSLWHTPAALTLISTCVPEGRGVGSSNSFSGALKSATLKLFMALLPRILVFAVTMPCPAGPDKRGWLVCVSAMRNESVSHQLPIGDTDLREQRARVLAEHRHALARRHVRGCHPKRQIEHLKRSTAVFYRRQRL